MDWLNDFAEFLNGTITLLTELPGEMRHGVYYKGETTQKDIVCNVQPSGRNRIVTDYGEYLDAEYTVYCAPDTDIKEGKEVLYKGTEYTIEKLVDWDSYYILYIKAVGL